MNNWIEWKGGKCPVEVGTLVDVRYRNGQENLHVPAGMSAKGSGSIKDMSAAGWEHYNVPWDIVAYSLHQSDQDVESNLAQIKKLVAKRDKLSAKLDKLTSKRDEIVAKIDALMGEAEKGIETASGVECSLSAGERISGMPDGVDVDDPRTWKAGDVIEVVKNPRCLSDIDIGYLFEFTGQIDGYGDPTILINGREFSPMDVKYKFISRPQ